MVRREGRPADPGAATVHYVGQIANMCYLFDERSARSLLSSLCNFEKRHGIELANLKVIVRSLLVLNAVKPVPGRKVTQVERPEPTAVSTYLDQAVSLLESAAGNETLLSLRESSEKLRQAIKSKRIRMQDREAFAVEDRIVKAMQKLFKRMGKGVRTKPPSDDALRLVSQFYLIKSQRLGVSKIASADEDADGAVMEKLLEDYGVDEANRIVCWCAGEGSVRLLEYVPRFVIGYYESVKRSVMDDPETQAAMDRVRSCLERAVRSPGGRVATLKDGRQARSLNPAERELMLAVFRRVKFAWFPREVQALIEQRPEMEIVDGFVRFTNE